MKVLMISTDRKVFDAGSDVRKRMLMYGASAEELHVIVYATRTHDVPRHEELAPHVHAYGTDSMSRWAYVFDAIKVGKSLSKPDLVTAQDPADTGLAALRLAGYFSAKLQIQMHGDIFGEEFKKESLRNWIRTRIARFVLPRADGVRVVSVRIWKNVIRALGARAGSLNHDVLPIFVDGKGFIGPSVTADLHALYPQFSHIVLMVSRLEREKNIELGIDAFKEVLKKIPDAGLVIAGDGSFRKRLEERVARLGIQKLVVFLGWRNDLASLYKTADTYLLTSNHEGYARTLVEAAFAKCAIVTTNVGIVGDVLKHEESALVAEPGDAAMLALCLVRLANDSVLRARLIAGAYARVTAHVSTSEQEYLEAYKRSWESCL